MKTYVCPVCGYVHEGNEPPEKCPQCGVPGSKFIEKFYPKDAKAIDWMEKNIEGRPVVLEAPGDSYSDYERVSVSTGLPTVIGWRVHEWLWSGNRKMVDRRRRDVRAIYTSASPRRVSGLLKKYGVSYVYIGNLERKLYGEKLNPDTLKELCAPVYSDDQGLLLKVVKVKAGE